MSNITLTSLYLKVPECTGVPLSTSCTTVIASDNGPIPIVKAATLHVNITPGSKLLINKYGSCVVY